MLTLKDCLEMAGLEAEDMDAITEHEHLPPMIAITKGADLLDHPWGCPALRQMALDNLQHAARAGDARRVAELQTVAVKTCIRHPGGFDRRNHPRF